MVCNNLYDIDLNIIANSCLSLEKCHVTEYILEKPYIHSFELLNIAYTGTVEAEVTKALSGIYDDVLAAKADIIQHIAEKQYEANKTIAFEHIHAALDRGIRFTEKQEFIDRVKYTIFEPTDIYRAEFIFIDIPAIQEYLRTSVKENVISISISVLVVGALIGLAAVLAKCLGITALFAKLIATFKLPVAAAPVSASLLANRIKGRVFNLIKKIKTYSRNSSNESGLPFKTTVDDSVFTMFAHGSTNFRFKNTGIWIYLEPQFRITK